MGLARIDRELFLAVSRFAVRTPWLHGAVSLFSNGVLVLLGALLVAAWWRARATGSPRLPGALWAPGAVLLGYGCSALVKLAVGEVRPCRVLRVPSVEACPAMTDYSFPSNHATIVAATAVAVLAVHRRLGLVALVVALLMGAARVYLGVHYPHDVLAGYVIGAAAGLTVPLVNRFVRVSPDGHLGVLVRCRRG